jgi:hypothetical protein
VQLSILSAIFDRRRLAVIVVTVIPTAALLIGPATASALTSYTWSGTTIPGTENWSSGTNWEGSAAAAMARLESNFGGYVDPFRLSSNLATGRVDQGVDFTGSGPLTAIGEAKILATGAPGWPEGGGVLYQLLEGPLKGQEIYIYEGVDASVQAGQTVKSGQQIAIFRPGGSIETGFADPAGVPLGHAEYYEGKVTRYGLQMLSLLQYIGIGRGQPSGRADRRQRRDVVRDALPVRPSAFGHLHREAARVDQVEQIEEGAD